MPPVRFDIASLPITRFRALPLGTEANAFRPKLVLSPVLEAVINLVPPQYNQLSLVVLSAAKFTSPKVDVAVDEAAVNALAIA